MCDMCVCAVCGHDGVWHCHNKHPFRGRTKRMCLILYIFSEHCCSGTFGASAKADSMCELHEMFSYISARCSCVSVCVGRIAERQWLG